MGATLPIRQDPDVMLLAVQQNGLALQFAAERVRSEWKVAREAVCQNRFAFRYLSSNLQLDPSIQKIATRHESPWPCYIDPVSKARWRSNPSNGSDFFFESDPTW